MMDSHFTRNLISELQASLVRLGCPIFIDGYYGPETDRWLRITCKKNNVDFESLTSNRSIISMIYTINTVAKETVPWWEDIPTELT